MALRATVDGIAIETDTPQEMVEVLRHMQQLEALVRPTPSTVTRPRRQWSETAEPAPVVRPRCKECGSNSHDGRYHAAQRRAAKRERAALDAAAATLGDAAEKLANLDIKPIPGAPVVRVQVTRESLEESRPAKLLPPPPEPTEVPRPLSWLKPAATTSQLELAPPEADGRVRVCPIHDNSRLSIARTQPNGRPVYMCPMGHETVQSMLQEPRA